MRRLSLVHMETLCTVARVATFTAAAERLHTTQSTISARIREMEAGLGVKLFARHGRSVTLTALGREFVQRAQPLLSQLNGLADALDDASGAPARVRIGGGPSTMSWLPEVLHQVLEAMPNLVYDLEVGMSASLVQAVEVGRLDIGVLAAGSIDPTRLEATSLGEEPMQWYIASRFYGTGESENSEALIDRHPVLLMPRSSFYFLRGMSALRQQGLTPRRVNTCNNTGVLLSLIEGGTGIGLIPEGLAGPALAQGRVTRVLIDIPVRPIEYLIVHHKEHSVPHLDLIVDLAKRASRGLLAPAASSASASATPTVD